MKFSLGIIGTLAIMIALSTIAMSAEQNSNLFDSSLRYSPSNDSDVKYQSPVYLKTDPISSYQSGNHLGTRIVDNSTGVVCYVSESKVGNSISCVKLDAEKTR